MPKAYLVDMDGVLVKGRESIPGAGQFVTRLKVAGVPFLMFTNNSRFTPADHRACLSVAGLDIPAEAIFTSAIATSHFLHQQHPRRTAYVIGESGLATALDRVGQTTAEHAPDYVVLGETKSYNHASLTTAVRLVAEGARFIPNNSDRVGPSADGIEPVCGAVAVLIAAATGVTPYFVDKPNPLTMREALRHLGTHSRDTVIIGDRIETDIVADIGSWMESILVLKGVTGREDLTRYPHRPGHVVDSVAAVILAAA